MAEMKTTLKDGRTVNLVSLTPGDTDRLLAMLSQMPEETLRWSMASYRREWVERWLNTPTLIHLAAEHADEIVGFACIEAYTHPRRRGIGYLGTYFHRDYAGSGLENAMMERVLDSARQKGVHKVDAGAVADDEYTIGLLEGFGFETEGRKRDETSSETTGDTTTSSRWGGYWTRNRERRIPAHAVTYGEKRAEANARTPRAS